MACGCNGNNDYWVRVLVNPVTDLDRLEHDLIQSYEISLDKVSLETFRRYKHLGYPNHSPASQVVLNAASFEMAESSVPEMYNLLIAKGVQYPLVVLSLFENISNDLLIKAVKDRLTERDLVEYVSNLKEI
jgi:hypothetical protein